MLAARFLDLTYSRPEENLAAEEAVFRSGEGPTLRVWQNQRSVVIGRAQLASMETDLEYCAAQGIPVIRRFTAGGTVYNGPGNLNWSFFVPNKVADGPLRYSWDAAAVFKRFGGLVATALGDCGVTANLRPPNSIVTAEGKVSGMAAYISSQGLLCHGTVLVDADLAELRRVSTPSSAPAPSRYPRSRVADVANTHVRTDDFVAALARQAGATPGPATDAESSLVETLAWGKYSDEKWNLGDPFP